MVMKTYDVASMCSVGDYWIQRSHILEGYAVYVKVDEAVYKYLGSHEDKNHAEYIAGEHFNGL